MDLDATKEATRVNWGKGRYKGLSKLLQPAANELCDACAVSAGQEVLDVAAGDGNVALACAFEGASVVASDIAPRMVELGRERSEQEGYEIEWVEADVEELPFEDDRFECVGSVFGAVLAPNPDLVTKELFRVVRPGNTVGLVAWVPDGHAQQLFWVFRRYMPPAEGPAHEQWGDEDTVRERFAPYANTIEMERKLLPFGADSPEAFVARMETEAPMQAAAREAMAPETYACLREDLLEVVRGWAGGDGPFTAEAEYLTIVARKKG